VVSSLLPTQEPFFWGCDVTVRDARDGDAAKRRKATAATALLRCGRSTDIPNA